MVQKAEKGKGNPRTEQHKTEKKEKKEKREKTATDCIYASQSGNFHAARKIEGCPTSHPGMAHRAVIPRHHSNTYTGLHSFPASLSPMLFLGQLRWEESQQYNKAYNRTNSQSQLNSCLPFLSRIIPLYGISDIKYQISTIKKISPGLFSLFIASTLC